MQKEGAPQKKASNSIEDFYKGFKVPQLAKNLGAMVTFPKIETRSGRRITIMRVEKKEQGKEFIIHCFGTCIMAYKAEGYSLDEFKQMLTNLGVLDWMGFSSADDQGWPEGQLMAGGPHKGLKQIVEPYPNGSFLP